MAFPTVESVTPSTFASDTTAHEVAMPATCNVGDLKLVLFADDGGDTVTTPTGWTSLYSGVLTNVIRGGAYARIHADGDPSTVDFVTSGAERAAAQTYRISGWYGAIESGVEARTVQTGTSQNPDPASFSPSWGSDDNLWVVSVAGSSTATLTSPPSGYTDSVSTDPGSGTAAAQQYSARKTATAATEDPGSWTFSASAAWIFSTIAVRGSATSSLTLDPSSGAGAAAGAGPTRASTLGVPQGGVAAASGNAPGLTQASPLTLTPTAGSTLVAGQAPVRASLRTPTAGSGTATGQAPSLIRTTQYALLTGTASATGSAATLSRTLAPLAGSAIGTASALAALTHTRTPQLGSALASGTAPTLSLQIAATLTPLPGAALVSGAQPALPRTFYLQPQTGLASAAGAQPIPGRTLPVIPGAALASGAQPTFTCTTILHPSASLITATGAQPVTSVQSAAAPVTGSAGITGNAPTLGLGLWAQTGLATASGAGPGALRGLPALAGTVWATGAQPTISVQVASAPIAGVTNAVGGVPALARGVSAQAGLASASGAQPTASLTLQTSSGVARADGAQPAVSLQAASAPISGSALALGAAPARTNTWVYQPASGSIAAVGVTIPALTQAIYPQRGVAAASGAAPILALQAENTPAPGTVAAQGAVPRVTRGLLAGRGTVTATGAAPGMSTGLDLTPQRGTAPALGATPTRQLQLAPARATASATGAGPTLAQVLAIPADAIIIAVGTAPGITHTLSPASGTAFAEGSSAPDSFVGQFIFPETGDAQATGPAPDLATTLELAGTGLAGIVSSGVGVVLTLPGEHREVALARLFAQLQQLEPDGVTVLRNPTTAITVPPAGAVVMLDAGPTSTDRAPDTTYFTHVAKLQLFIPVGQLKTLSDLEADVAAVLRADRTLGGIVDQMFLVPSSWESLPGGAGIAASAFMLQIEYSTETGAAL